MSRIRVFKALVAVLFLNVAVFVFISGCDDNNGGRKINCCEFLDFCQAGTDVTANSCSQDGGAFFPNQQCSIDTGNCQPFATPTPTPTASPTPQPTRNSDAISNPYAYADRNPNSNSDCKSNPNTYTNAYSDTTTSAPMSNARSSCDDDIPNLNSGDCSGPLAVAYCEDVEDIGGVSTTLMVDDGMDLTAFITVTIASGASYRGRPC